MTWPVFEKRPFGDGRFFTARFVRHDAEARKVTYRVELFEGERLQGEFPVRVDVELGEDGDPAEIDALRNRISGVAYHHVFVDGVLYQWRIDEDPNAGSFSFSHRGISLQDTARITGPDGFTIRFDTLDGDDSKYGWWRPHAMSAAITERAVRIARRTGKHVLAGAEREEAYFGSRGLQDELSELDDLLRELSGRELVRRDIDVVERCLLAIGCGTAADDREAWAAIDDWIASHANDLVAARDKLQLCLDGHSLSQRSAIQFLIDISARVNVELGLDTATMDEQLKQRRRKNLPWGIPRSHWWWRQGATTDRDPPYDPYDD